MPPTPVVKVVWRGVRRALRRAGYATLLVLLVWLVVVGRRVPRTDRLWADDVAQLAEVAIDGDTLRVKNLRSGGLRGADFVWEDETYDLREIESMWFGVDEFIGQPAFAHGMLHWVWRDGRSVTVSVEARKEQGEEYSAWQGLWRNYELTYVWADTADMLDLRVNDRAAQLRLHPLRLNSLTPRAVLEGFAAQTNTVHTEGAWYHSVLHNCTNELAHVVNDLAAGTIPLTRARVQTGYADARLHEWGMLNTTLPWDEQLITSRKVTQLVQAATANGGQAWLASVLEALQQEMSEEIKTEVQKEAERGAN